MVTLSQAIPLELTIQNPHNVIITVMGHSREVAKNIIGSLEKSLDFKLRDAPDSLKRVWDSLLSRL